MLSAPGRHSADLGELRHVLRLVVEAVDLDEPEGSPFVHPEVHPSGVGAVDAGPNCASTAAASESSCHQRATSGSASHRETSGKSARRERPQLDRRRLGHSG